MKVFSIFKRKPAKKESPRKLLFFLIVFIALIGVSSYSILSEFSWNGNPISWLRAREHYDQAKQLEARYKFAAAEKRYLSAVSIFPSDWRILLGLSNTYLGLNKAEEAEKYLKKAIAISNQSVLWKKLAESLFAQKKFEEAQKAMSEAIKLEPSGSSAFAQLAYMLASEGKMDDAQQAFKNSESLEKTDPQYWYFAGLYHEILGDDQRADSEFKQAVSLDRSKAEYCQALGLLMYKQGRYSEAEKYLKRANQLNSLNIDYWYALADAYFKLDHLASAEDCYKRCTEIAPNQADCWVRLAYTRVFQSEYREAEKPLKRALELDPSENTIKMYLESLIYLKKYKEASSLLTLKKPEDLAPAVRLKLAYACTEAGDFANAKALLDLSVAKAASEQELQASKALIAHLQESEKKSQHKEPDISKDQERTELEPANKTQ